MDDERNVISIRERAPALGDEHYEKAQRIKSQKSDEASYMLTTTAKHLQAMMGAERVTLRQIARAVEALQRKERCQHPSALVDEDRHRLECETCGEIMDPIAFLLRICFHERILYRELVDRDKLVAEMKALRSSVESLARLEKNAKARLKRARDKKDEIAKDLGLPERHELTLWQEMGDLMLAAKTRKFTDDEMARWTDLRGKVEDIARKRAAP